MTDWGLLPTGFKPKTFQAIKEELEAHLKQNVDPTLRFTPDTIAGQLTGIIAHQARQVWEMAAGLFSAIDCNSASGKALDSLCALTGTYRKQAAPSRTMVQVTLKAGATLPKGTIVADVANAKAQFRTQKELKNKTGKQAVLPVEVIADESGPIHVKAACLTKIITPHEGLIAVNNPEDAIPGRLIETDDELRFRRLKELGALGSGTHGAMTARLWKLRAVQAVHIEEKHHQFCAYVLGGDEQEIAETIWQHKPLGVHTYGKISREVKISNGQIKLIRFSRPLIIELAIDVALKVSQNLSGEEIAKLKNAIVKYCQDKFSFGHVPYPSQIYPVLFAQEKVIDITKVELSRHGSTEPIPKVVQPNEVLAISEQHIHLKQAMEVYS